MAEDFSNSGGREYGFGQVPPTALRLEGSVVWASDGFWLWSSLAFFAWASRGQIGNLFFARGGSSEPAHRRVGGANGDYRRVRSHSTYHESV